MFNDDRPDPWGAWYAPWYDGDKPGEDDYPGSEGYDMERIPDQVIMGLIDGYDDPHIDSVVFELLRLRKLERKRTGEPEPSACADCDHPGCRYMRGG